MAGCWENRGMLSRREAAAGLLVGLCAPALAQTTPPPRFTTRAIDIHHHFLPPDYKTFAAASLRGYATGADEVLRWTPERSLAAMDVAGVDRAVLSISAPGTFFTDADQARSLARHCNDYAAALVRDHPGRFSFFAALPMPDVDGSIREAERALALPGAVGLGLLSNYRDRYLGEAAFRPLFDWANRRGTRIYVHPTSASCCTALTPNIPAPLIELPVDTARTISSLLWSGVLSAGDRTRFIFSHGGGAMPMVMDRVAAVGFMRPELARLVPEGPQAALARLYVDTASVATKSGMAAIGAWLPPEQILYGTDYPWGDPARGRADLARLAFAPERLAMIERDNAARLLATA